MSAATHDDGIGAVSDRLARVETKIDMLIQQGAERTADHEARLRALETWRARAVGAALGAGGGGGAVVGAVVTFLTKGAA